jgi:uncharacterized membrane protein YgdD (TMEM256/DUF423 family)
MSDATLARRTLAVGALLGLFGVAAGAFGAHALRGAVSERDLEIWQTAAYYQQLHAVVLVAMGLWARDAILAPPHPLTRSANASVPPTGGATRALAVASTCFTVGVLVFSGTLYTMVLGGPRMLGAVTPLGGLGLMAGWAALAVHALRRPRG